MASHPGKKLLFMGGELGQFSEWKDLEDIDWELLDYEMHEKMHNYTKALNQFYLKEPSLWQQDHTPDGFEWIDANNFNQSIISFIRKGKASDDQLIILCNFTPVVYESYKIGVPDLGDYEEIFNSDASHFGGSGQVNAGLLKAEDKNWHSQPYCLSIKVPPLAFVVIRLKNKQYKLTTDEGGKKHEKKKGMRSDVTSRRGRKTSRVTHSKLS